MVFQPEPSNPVHCAGNGCGSVIVGYSKGTCGSVYCTLCAEYEWQKEIIWYEKVMKADRTILGDEVFVKLVFGDGWVEPSGTQSVVPGKFYFISWNHKLTGITGSSGYCDSPEATWTKMADKIDKYLREPYRRSNG